MLLQHGLLDSSAAWVLNGRGRSLAFILADAGFDVWLGNSRGNVFSREHVNYDPGEAAFWDFSWDDMARWALGLWEVGVFLSVCCCDRGRALGSWKRPTRVRMGGRVAGELVTPRNCSSAREGERGRHRWENREA